MQSRKVSTFLVFFLLLSFIFPCFVFGDASTTTEGTAYKSLDANTEMYAVTDSSRGNYVNYGMKNEQSNGVYYGRIARGGTTLTGQYGLINLEDLSDESIVSFYYGLDDNYSLEYWSYLYGKALDGNRALLINLNYIQEGKDCLLVSNGYYDSKLIDAFKYLNTLSCPTFVRIGGEMNVWSNPASVEEYISSYNHIGRIARKYSPNTALIYSPNYSSAYKVDMDMYYPDDSYVDWVGTSLYYNKYSNNGDRERDEFYGVGKYGDALLNIQQTVNLSRLHKKPIIITEGGSHITRDGIDTSYFAAEHIEKAYSYLTMVYPEIKAIIYSDADFGYSTTKYQLSSNLTVKNAYESATSKNKTLLHSIKDKGLYYSTLNSLYANDWFGTMEFAAYSYSSDKLECSWYIDDKWIHSSKEYPFTFKYNVDTLSTGTHTISVKFSNGATKSHTFKVGVADATPTDNDLYVDNKLVQAKVYKINDNNYFKVRDVAYILNNSESQFSVEYNSLSNSVELVGGKEYKSVGGELFVDGSKEVETAYKTSNKIYINGKLVELVVYNINDNNYFKLRDLGSALDFYVGYDSKTNSILIDSSKRYTD